MYSISFNGIDCLQYGIIPVRRPSIPAPELRVTETTIPGRDGVLTETDGTYSPITIPIEFNFMRGDRNWGNVFRQAKKWLRGSGWLILSDDLLYQYKVYYCKIADTERTSRRIGTFTAEFVCDPYTYVRDGQKEYASDDVTDNPYSVSHPTYILSGSGACTLTVNGKTMQATVNGKMTIDTELMIAYNADGVNQNNLLTGDYEDLYLQEGENTISATSGFTMSVIPNWRVL